MDKPQEIIDKIRYLGECATSSDIDDLCDDLEQELQKNKDIAIKIKRVKAYNRIVERWGKPIGLKELSEAGNIQWQNLDFYIAE